VSSPGDRSIRVGFVGLGSQGGPIARRIVDAGFPTSLWARRPESLDPYRDTDASFVASPERLGAASDVLAVCVVDDAGVDAVLRGPGGALAGMADGGIVVIHSTVHPDTCRRLQDDFPDLHVLDAPVSGGGHKAAAGELLVMVGGPAEVLGRCRAVLDTFADPILHLGPLGAGQEAKVLNNTVFAAQLALASEVFALAGERNLDKAAVATILSNGSGRSYAAEVVAGNGFDIEALAPLAGALLAKDVAILVDRAGLADTVLLAAADQALDRLGVARQRGPAPRA
jgi:3-hydroxyisobutyrate dehydrogenase-like beta-hydroxyacid dehydrogenase